MAGQIKMETVLISDFNRIEHIYKTCMKQDFPGSELKPLASIHRMWKHKSYDCYQMTENDDLTGYAFFVKLHSGSSCKVFHGRCSIFGK